MTFSQVKKYGAGLLASGAALAANATTTGVDVTSTVATITDQLAPIGLIGAAILGVTVAIAAFVWIRKGVK